MTSSPYLSFSALSLNLKNNTINIKSLTLELIKTLNMKSCDAKLHNIINCRYTTLPCKLLHFIQNRLTFLKKDFLNRLSQLKTIYSKFLCDKTLNFIFCNEYKY